MVNNMKLLKKILCALLFLSSCKFIASQEDKDIFYLKEEIAAERREIISLLTERLSTVDILLCNLYVHTLYPTCSSDLRMQEDKLKQDKVAIQYTLMILRDNDLNRFGLLCK